MRALLFCVSLAYIGVCSGAEDRPTAHYVPVVTPNGTTLPWVWQNGTKVFHLTAEKVKPEFAPGLTVDCWGYNGQTPGPTIEVVEGDRIRIYVTNKLDAPTSIHWHGIEVPNGMDGVAGLTQAPINPSETFKYEFTVKQHGTFMYHSHYDEMTQIGMGMMRFFIIRPKSGYSSAVDRDFAIFLGEWYIPSGGSTPDPSVMLDFNYFTFNSKVFPGTAPLLVQRGERVRIRFANLSMDSHPIHIHGTTFIVTGRTGSRLTESQWNEDNTINVPPGSTRDVEFVALQPGDWALHCHKTHHTMNGMGHGLPNVIGVELGNTANELRRVVPGYMQMGKSGLADVMNMKRPPNTLPMGSPGPFGALEMGGMFTIIKVRDHLTGNQDPGWYRHPKSRIAKRVPESEIPSLIR